MIARALRDELRDGIGSALITVGVIILGAGVWLDLSMLRTTGMVSAGIGVYVVIAALVCEYREAKARGDLDVEDEAP